MLRSIFTVLILVVFALPGQAQEVATVIAEGLGKDIESAVQRAAEAALTQVVGSFPDVLVVPQASLIYTADGALLFAVSSSRAVPVPVTLVKKIDQARAIVKPRAMPKGHAGGEASTANSTASDKQGSATASKPPADAGNSDDSTASASTSKLPEIMLKEGLEIVVEGSGKLKPGAKLKTTPYKPVDVSVVTGLPKNQASSGD